MHVAATFRVDGIASMMPEPDWDAAIGRECLFESPSEVWNDLHDNPGDYMPCGSEGTLQKAVWVNPERSDLARYSVMAFGDLRDYDDMEALREWFKRSCGNVGMLREAAMFADCEDGQKAMLSCHMGYDGPLFAESAWMER